MARRRVQILGKQLAAPPSPDGKAQRALLEGGGLTCHSLHAGHATMPPPSLCPHATMPPRVQNQGGAAPEVLQPRVCPRKIPRKPSHCPLAQCEPPQHSPDGTVFSTLPQGFSTVAQTIKITRFIWGLHFPFVKCEGPNIPLVKCEGSHKP